MIAQTTFPRIGLYAVADWCGRPFLRDDGTLDMQSVADHARFGTIIVEATPLLHRPEIVAALRMANPAVRILAFQSVAQAYFNPAHSLDLATDFTGQCYAAVVSVPDRGGFLWSAKWKGDLFDPEHVPDRGWSRPGAPLWSGSSLNLASEECTRALARVIIERVLGSDLFVGWFADRFAQSIAWSHSPVDGPTGDSIDLERAGYPDLATFDAAYRANHRLLCRLLHDAAPSDDFMIELNSSTTDPLEAGSVNGQMDEGFPTNPGGGHDWLKVMNGIWQREKDRGPWSPENWINMTADGTGGIPFGLGSACLTDSARFTCSGTNGRPDLDGRERIWSPLYEPGWLGHALAPAIVASVPAFGRGAALLPRYIRRFEGGAVEVCPALRSARFYGVRG